MNQLKFHHLELSDGRKEPVNWESFNEWVDVHFSTNTGDIIIYQLNVISLVYIDNQPSIGIPACRCVVQEFFDLKSLKSHIEHIQKECQFLSLENEMQLMKQFLKPKE